jgi:hypothetical protein
MSGDEPTIRSEADLIWISGMVTCTVFAFAAMIHFLLGILLRRLTLI